MRPAYNLDETKGNHEHTPEGIKPKEYVFEEFPKQVGVNADGQPIIVKDAEEEKRVVSTQAT